MRVNSIGPSLLSLCVNLPCRWQPGGSDVSRWGTRRAPPAGERRALIQVKKIRRTLDAKFAITKWATLLQRVAYFSESQFQAVTPRG